MFLFSNHQGSASFLAGECAQQNWTSLRQGCFNIDTLARQIDTTYNNNNNYFLNFCRMETAVYTRMQRIRDMYHIFLFFIFPHVHKIHLFFSLSICPSFYLSMHPWIHPFIFQCFVSSLWVDSFWVNTFHLCLPLLRLGGD